MIYSKEISRVVMYLLEADFGKIVIEGQQIRATRENVSKEDHQRINFVVEGLGVVILGEYRDEDIKIKFEDIETYIKEQL